jgi:hypothetical protein
MIILGVNTEIPISIDNINGSIVGSHIVNSGIVNNANNENAVDNKDKEKKEGGNSMEDESKK